MIKRFKGQFFTIPNILCYFRIVLVPVMIYFYLNELYIPAVAALFLSGLSDVIDGKIARLTNQVSDLGKILDPIADKLTQCAMLLCVSVRHKIFLIPLALLLIKEISVSVFICIYFVRTDKINSSRWYGKLCTVLLYCSIILCLFWPSIPEALVSILTVLCSCAIVLSMVLYIIFFSRIIFSGKTVKK